MVELRVPPSSSLLPYSANVKLTARLSALAVRKILNMKTIVKVRGGRSAGYGQRPYFFNFGTLPLENYLNICVILLATDFRVHDGKMLELSR